LYWTKVASKDLIDNTNKISSNTAYYLSKHVAQQWTNHLELINSTVARGEYLSDDYQATIDGNLSQKQGKADLIQVNRITKDINYMRRQLNHFWRAMILNFERLGIQLGSEQTDSNVPLALRDAQKDLLTIHARLQPLRQRTEELTTIANDLANLRAAFRGVHDGEFGLRLSLFASIVFPLTLIAGIFSMNDKYLPGAKAFWKFWAVSLPFVAAFALVLVYGWRPFRGLRHDVKEYISYFRRGREEQASGTVVVDHTVQKGTRRTRDKWHLSLRKKNGSVKDAEGQILL
jgi:Mg2+ and Co2+ transporter CorA